METIDNLIAEGRFDQAMAALDNAIQNATEPAADADPEQAKYMARLYFERGKLNWRIGQHREAISDYSMAVSLDASSPASLALGQARAILDFHAPDLYNP